MEKYNSKLRIGLISDAHIEFGQLNLINHNDIDVLVLAGDIITPGLWNRNDSNGARLNTKRQKEFLSNIDRDFSDIPKIQIAGNHEYYHSDINIAMDIIKENAKTFNSKWYIGEKLLVTIKDVNIYASTLWTNMNNRNRISMLDVRRGMNDFQLVNNQDHVFSPEDAADIHDKTMKWMTESWTEGRNLVVSHHLPSFQSVTVGFRDSRINDGYASDLDSWILEHKPVAWLHGHSHVPVDYMLGDTRITSHPRGYIGYEPNVDPDYNYKVIEV